ncbi:MAG: NAD(P)H-dependent oxidoreductase [Pseudomonadota bacterium]
MNLLGLSGSLRKEATNRKLLMEAQRLFAPESYVEADLNLPLYDGDLEADAGVPDAVKTLAAQIEAADAVVISTPEYNQSISGVLKNALDWVSRVDGSPWAGKPVAIMSAAAGRSGGARAQYALRLCMQPFRPRILQGPEVMVAASSKEFDEDGRLTGEMYLKMLQELMDALKAEIGR